MKYEYKCVNSQDGGCDELNKLVIVEKPMTSNEISICDACGEDLQKIYSSFGLKTAGDGFKS